MIVPVRRLSFLEHGIVCGLPLGVGFWEKGLLAGRGGTNASKASDDHQIAQGSELRHDRSGWWVEARPTRRAWACNFREQSAAAGDPSGNRR
jgi:hypothetical protein